MATSCQSACYVSAAIARGSQLRFTHERLAMFAVRSLTQWGWSIIPAHGHTPSVASPTLVFGEVERTEQNNDASDSLCTLSLLWCQH